MGGSCRRSLLATGTSPQSPLRPAGDPTRPDPKRPGAPGPIAERTHAEPGLPLALSPPLSPVVSGRDLPTALGIFGAAGGPILHACPPYRLFRSTYYIYSTASRSKLDATFTTQRRHCSTHVRVFFSRGDVWVDVSATWTPRRSASPELLPMRPTPYCCSRLLTPGPHDRSSAG